jgi:hypothetical protein
VATKGQGRLTAAIEAPADVHDAANHDGARRFGALWGLGVRVVPNHLERCGIWRNLHVAIRSNGLRKRPERGEPPRAPVVARAQTTDRADRQRHL